MANKINLDPALGSALVSSISELCNGMLNEIAKRAYDSAMLLGNNNTSQQFEEKFMQFQSAYNSNIFPALMAVQDTFKAHTNYAELQEAMKVDTSVDQSTAGLAAADGLGAAKSKIQTLTDLIS